MIIWQILTSLTLSKLVYLLDYHNNRLIFVVFIGSVVCTQQFSKAEIYALTRDGAYRSDPDALFYGFLPVWPLILLSMSGKHQITC